MKRQKFVFSNMEKLAPVWAAQKQNNARCPTNRGRDGYSRVCAGFFEGKNLFSYGNHYLLGRILELNGRKIAAVNFTKWSNTTTSHSWLAMRAAESAGYLVAHVNTGEGKGLDSRSTDSEVCAAIESYLLNQGEILRSRIEGLKTEVFSPSIVEGIQVDVSEYNDTIRALGFPSMRIVFSADCLSDALALGEKTEAARKNHATRKQAIFDFSGRFSKKTCVVSMCRKNQKHVS